MIKGGQLKIMITDLLKSENENEKVEIIGLLKKADTCISTNNTKYINIILTDRTGKLDCKRWSATDQDIQVLTSGKVIKLFGLLVKYRNSLQLKVLDYQELDQNEYKPEEFVDGSRKTTDQLKEEFNDLVVQIKDKEIKNLILTCYKEHEDKLFAYPAAMSLHHSYRGGLMYHMISVCNLALNIAKNYQYLPINLDYVIAGSLLHDIGKTIELSGSEATTYTIAGNLLGHISIGFALVMEVGKRLNLTQEKLDVIGHIILSHHGKLEFGSPVLCSTIEAIIVHYADEIDSKMEILVEPLKQSKPGKLINKINGFDSRILYYPESYNEEENDINKEEN